MAVAKTAARRNAHIQEHQPVMEVRFDQGEFMGSTDACKLRAVVP